MINIDRNTRPNCQQKHAKCELVVTSWPIDHPKLVCCFKLVVLSWYVQTCSKTYQQPTVSSPTEHRQLVVYIIVVHHPCPTSDYQLHLFGSLQGRVSLPLLVHIVNTKLTLQNWKCICSLTQIKQKMFSLVSIYEFNSHSQLFSDQT